MTVFVVLLGFLVWQLAQGPISLSLITPNLRDALSDSFGPYKVDFEEAYLVWSERTRSLDIAVQKTRIFDANDSKIANFPEIDLRFSLNNLLLGKLTPSRVELVEASAIIQRTRTGSIQLGLSDISDAQPEEDKPSIVAEGDETDLIGTLLASVIDVATDDETLPLSDFAIRDGTLTFLDQQSGFLLLATNASLSFERTNSGADVLLSAVVELENGASTISAAGSYDREVGEANFEASISEFLPSDLVKGSDSQGWIDRVQVPLSSSASLILDSEGKVLALDLIVSGAAGVIELDGVKVKKDSEPEVCPPDQMWACEGEYRDPNVQPPPLQSVVIDDITLEVSLDPQSQRYELRQLSMTGPGNNLSIVGGLGFLYESEGGSATGLNFDLRADDTVLNLPGILAEELVVEELEVSGSVDTEKQAFALSNMSFSAYGASASFQGGIESGLAESGELSPGIRLEGSAENLPVRDMIKFWPTFVGMGGRDWINDNMDQGLIERADVKIDLPPQALSGSLPPDAIQVDFSFADGTAHYIKGMTPLKGVSGSGTLLTNSLRIETETGRVGNLNVTNGVVYIPRLSPKGAVAEFGATVSGDTQEILSLIDMEPLKLTRKLGIDPNTVGGTAVANFEVGRPMRRRVPIEAVTYAADANANALSLPDIFGDLSFRNGDLKLDIDTTGITGTGTLNLAGVPAKLDWTEKFNSGDAPSTTYVISIDTDAENYAKLGYPLGGVIKGPLRSKITTTGKGMNIQQADIVGDFTDAIFDLSAFLYEKPIGEPGQVSFTFRPGKNGLKKFSSIKLDGNDLNVRGEMQLAENLSLVSADFPTVKMGDEMDVALSGDRNPRDGRLSLNVLGQKFAAGAIVKDYLTSDAEGDDATPLTIVGDVSRVRLNSDVVLNDAAMTLKTDGDRLSQMEVEGSFPDGGGVYIGVAGPETGRREMIVSSSDAGAFISGLYEIESVSGGQLDLSARIEPERLYYRQQDEPVEDPDGSAEADIMYGEAFISDFQVTDLPLLARLLSSAGSFQGVAELLNGEGLSFNELSVPFVMLPERIEFSDVRAAGSSVGVTMEGIYYSPIDEIDFSGTLVPIYTVNKVLGAVPLIGDLFVSRKGEGVLGFTYSIQGPLDEARVFVNPLSVMAPGFFRRLFQMGGPKVSRPREPGEGDPMVRAEDEIISPEGSQP